jgi:FixJ family two-component response regulator
MVSSARVAIIDDDEGLCSSLVDLMQSLGYQAESFESAETFLAASDLRRFDRIIADIQMPGMGGLSLVRKLQEMGGMPPVILITAMPDKRLDHEAVAVGAQCLLRKPFDTSALLACLEGGPGEDPP